MVERRAAEALGVRVDTLWQSLVRPEPISPARLRTICCLAVTLKLDGRRAALMFVDQRDSGIIELTSGGIRCIESGTTDGRVTMLDCELYGEVYHVFDVLAVLGEDVRYLSLYERARLAASAVNSSPALHGRSLRVLAKPYAFLSCDHPTPRHLIEDGLKQRGPHTDGLILVNAIDPYWVPPLKFKENITTDFLLQRAKHGIGFVFLSKKTTAPSSFGAFQPLRDKRGTVVRLLTPPKAVATALAKKPNGVIVECARTATGGARFKRLRLDRLAPNRTSVADENAELHDAGCHRRSWLLKSFSSPVDGVVCFWKYCETLWRFVVKHATQNGGRMLIVLGRSPMNIPDGIVERGLLPSHLAHAELLDLSNRDSDDVEKLIRNENRRLDRPGVVLLPLSLEQLIAESGSARATAELCRTAVVAGIFLPGDGGKTPENLASDINGCMESGLPSPVPCAAYGTVGILATSLRPFIIHPRCSVGLPSNNELSK